MLDEPHSLPPPEAVPPPRTWGPLATLGLSALALLVYLLIQAAVPVLVPALARPENFGLLFALPTLVAFPPGVLLLLGLARLRRGLPVRDYLGLSLPTLAQALGALAPLAVFQLVFEQLSQHFHRPLVPKFVLDAYRTAHSLPILYLALVVAGPAFEELLFRGFLLSGLRPTLGRWGSALGSALLFTLAHLGYDALDLSSILVLGLLFAAIRLTTGSTLLTISLHGITNLVLLLEAAWMLSGGG